MKKYKIGVFGSAAGLEEAAVTTSVQLARELGKQKEITLITGACLGIPYLVAKNAYNLGIDIWGYSPNVDRKSAQKETPDQDLNIYKRLIYINKDYEFADNILVCRKFRNVTSTSHCDAGIIVSGRWGTLNEFTNLYDMGKVIGVLTKTGGSADEIERLNKKITKPSKAKIFFSDSPKELVKLVLAELDIKR